MKPRPIVIVIVTLITLAISSHHRQGTRRHSGVHCTGLLRARQQLSKGESLF